MELADADLWRLAAENEIESLQDLNVYSLVPRCTVPRGKNVISTKWVFKIKPNKTFKARLVARGWNQVQSRDPFSAGTCTERSPALNRAPGTIANSAKTALLRAGQSLISAGTGTIEVVFDLRYSTHACGANRERNGSTLLL